MFNLLRLLLLFVLILSSRQTKLLFDQDTIIEQVNTLQTQWLAGYNSHFQGKTLD